MVIRHWSVWLLSTLAVGASCSFKPRGLGGAADAAADAPLPPVDARADGAPADARGADAAAGADAEIDPCPVASEALTLGEPKSGNIGGPSHYEPTCTVGTPTGGEDLYHVDVPVGGLIDLVVDVEEKAADLDTVVDVTPMCRGQAQPGGFCEDSGPAGAGEVVVDEFDAGGRRYIAVDSLSGGGGYSVNAFTRAVVASGAACTPDLTASRCGLGEHCVDRDNDGVATCEVLPAISDSGANDDPCTTSVALSDDGVFDGQVESLADVDVIALDPPAERRLRVTVHDGRGGCAVDVQAEVLVGGSCTSALPVASDDNSGLGPCPKLPPVTLPGGQRSWLRIAPSARAKLRGDARYEVVVDFY